MVIITVVITTFKRFLDWHYLIPELSIQNITDQT